MFELIEKNLLEIGHFSLSILSVIKVMALFLFQYLFLIFLKKFFTRLAKKGNKIEGRYHSIYLLIKYILWLLAVVVALSFLGIKPTLFLAGGAAVLVGIGFGLKNIFNDIISGVFLLVDGTIKIGDVLEVEGKVAKVKRLTLRNTQVISRDEHLIIIPNHKLIEETVHTWSDSKKTARFSLRIAVEYGTDAELVKKILLEAAHAHERVANKPLPMVRFVDFSETALKFDLHFWCDDLFGIEQIQSDLRFTIERLARAHKMVLGGK